ncbi:permease-like cell division protein FtsX [Aurantivibrio infirmus]
MSKINRSADYRVGASQRKTRIKDKLRAYWLHHRIVAIDSLMRLLKSPLQSLLTWLVVAIALALPAILYLGLAQFQQLGEDWETKPQLSIYIKIRASEDAVVKLQNELQSKSEIENVEYISPKQALLEFEEYSGLGNVLQTLDDNPLPAVLLIQPSGANSSPEQLESLKNELLTITIVDDVQIDMEWVRRLQQIMILGQRLVAALGLLLALGVLLVIGNTIGLAIESRRDEIVIVKLVGGTNAFVRRPFLYTGFWYGLGGGLIAWLLLFAGVNWLSGPIENLASLYQSEVELKGLNFVESLAILLGSGVLGLMGAALTVSKQLHTIEPT